MMPTWEDVLRGAVEPWPLARVLWAREDASGKPLGTPLAWVVIGRTTNEWALARVDGESVRVGVSVTNRDTTIDLTDNDTCGNFDWRLALRIGAPPEAVRDGVMVKLHAESLWVWAGMRPPRSHFEGAGPAWVRSVFVGTDDELLARSIVWTTLGEVSNG